MLKEAITMLQEGAREMARRIRRPPKTIWRTDIRCQLCGIPAVSVYAFDDGSIHYILNERHTCDELAICNLWRKAVEKNV